VSSPDSVVRSISAIAFRSQGRLGVLLNRSPPGQAGAAALDRVRIGLGGRDPAQVERHAGIARDRIAERQRHRRGGGRHRMARRRFHRATAAARQDFPENPVRQNLLEDFVTRRPAEEAP
jgi:hypothetical protein